MAYTFLKLAEDVLEEAKTRENLLALSQMDIWNKAGEYNLRDKIKSEGKTPWQSIGARIYVDMKDNASSVFLKLKGHRFALKKYAPQNLDISDKEVIPAKKTDTSTYNERDLHPLLTRFVYSNSHFHCYAKTIYHETSTKRQKGQNHWLHPDLMGVYFPFDSYQAGTLDIIKSFYESKMKIFSFEMKKEINSSNLRECFFQAVSNSSWANEGYLVALKYDDDDDFHDEMQRLNNAFGIGFIQLDPVNIDQSIVLILAKCHDQIDWDTLDRLIGENPDVKSFVDSINEDVSLQKVKNKSEYDEVFDDAKMTKWVEDKKIPA